MQIEIQASNQELKTELRHFVERRLGYALSRHGDRVRRVAVWLSDVRGARGGRDKRCLMRIGLSDQPDVVVDNTETDIRIAIHRCADRAGWTIARRLQRERYIDRWHSQPARQRVSSADFA